MTEVLKPILKAIIDTRYKRARKFWTTNYDLKANLNSKWEVGYVGALTIVEWLKDWGIEHNSLDEYHAAIALRPLSNVCAPLPLFGVFLSSLCLADARLPEPESPETTLRDYVRLHAFGYEGKVANALTENDVWGAYAMLIRKNSRH